MAAPLAALLSLLALSACSTRDPFANPFAGPEPGWAEVPYEVFAPYGLPMFDGRRGTVLTWADLSDAVAWADVIIIGEQHDDPLAHKIEETVAIETLARFPRTAISMEMLERDEQPYVDAYMRDEITVDEFIDKTKSRDWAGKDTWVIWYQPIVDAAKNQQARLIAANAPRTYVRMARTDGYEALRALPADQQLLFDIPLDEGSPMYKSRFDEVMREGHDEKKGDGPPPTQEALDRGYRSQHLWDATMARSIMRARDTALPQPGGIPAAVKVIHMVGQFHADFEGGLVSEIGAYSPLAKVLVISCQRRAGRELAPEDRNRAAIVIYTGATPQESAGTPAPAPAPTAAPTPTPAS